jgi:hypothetical protein
MKSSHTHSDTTASCISPFSPFYSHTSADESDHQNKKVGSFKVFDQVEAGKMGYFLLNECSNIKVAHFIEFTGEEENKEFHSHLFDSTLSEF